MALLSYLFLPFALLYGLVVWLRNKFYDWGWFKSNAFNLPVIGIGNLSAGGTGKTPMTEYIVGLLIVNGFRPAVLSRGYGRKSKGYLLADSQSTATEIGDEPFQIYKKFPGISLAVCEDRVEGIKQLMLSNPEIDAIILDDCYQHRKLRPGRLILLTDYNAPYYTDMLLPSGRLREWIAGRQRAHTIIMTKCPHLHLGARKLLKSNLKPFPHQDVYFTSIEYQGLIGISGQVIANPESLLQGGVLLFTGIAKPGLLQEHIQQSAEEYADITFPDHHNFTEKDIAKIEEYWSLMKSKNKILLTTEKDWRRLEGTAFASRFANLPLYYLPIGLKWESREKLSFDENLIRYVRENKGNGSIHP